MTPIESSVAFDAIVLHYKDNRPWISLKSAGKQVMEFGPIVLSEGEVYSVSGLIGQIPTTLSNV